MILYNIGLDSKDMMEPYFRTENSRSADFCFGNIYMWDERYIQTAAPLGDRLITRLVRNGETFFAYPVGKGELSPSVDAMRGICAAEGIPLKICGITEEHKAELQNEFDGHFEIYEDRNFSDYIYSIEKLTTYSGKALHAKKNFCNRFEKEHEWHFDVLNADNITECVKMLDDWTEESSERLTGDISFEHTAVLKGFEHYDELELFGGALYADGRLVGFSVGEKISDDTFCTHFEKAYPDVAGAYPMVCRELAKAAKTVYPNINYVNREDDMGHESLRRSKLSYKPEYILMKYVAIWKE